ncbi:hypothetical protein M569_06231, partial [Genlisea aurea]
VVGAAPEVVARGGYSGFFPDSSQSAYDFALDSGLLGTILYCNLHFTKDGDGFCVSQINLQNSTNIGDVDPKGSKSYSVYGEVIHGWFGLDYPAKFLFDNVTLRQNIFTRQGVFDGAPIVSPFNLMEDKNGKPTRLWLNIENDLFYQQHKISAESFILDQFQQLPEFISSPEIGFLKSIKPQLGRSKTKLVFTFLQQTDVEPTTKQTYGSLIKQLAMIKSFAYGIVVPKDYIWPVNGARILQPATTLVQDAHKAGLAVYADGFANDNLLSFNYSYDPAKEYLQFFIANPQFSVDGVLSEFPSTAAEAIALIISHNGASGDFPGATDLAYEKAISDGADIIDCSVQMTQDGVAFCSDRADLLDTTTASAFFIDQTTNIPQIQSADGVFSFDLSWDQIQSLQPQMESFFEWMVRNPANKNKGKFVTLVDFMELAKTKAVPGILINIENAAYLASNKGVDVVGTVSSALRNASFDKEIYVQSDDTSVLSKFKDLPNVKRVFHLMDAISGAPHDVSEEMKTYADVVFVHRDAIVVPSDNFAFNFTDTVSALHAANLSVFVGILKNEFENLIFDYLSDPYVEISTFYSLKVDGFITDFPATASMFARSSCSNQKAAYNIQPIVPGFLFEADPVAEPPLLSHDEVVDPPLPAVAKNSTGSQASTSTPIPSPKPPATTPTSSSSLL